VALLDGGAARWGIYMWGREGGERKWEEGGDL